MRALSATARAQVCVFIFDFSCHIVHRGRPHLCFGPPPLFVCIRDRSSVLDSLKPSLLYLLLDHPPSECEPSLRMVPYFKSSPGSGLCSARFISGRSQGWARVCSDSLMRWMGIRVIGKGEMVFWINEGRRRWPWKTVVARVGLFNLGCYSWLHKFRHAFPI